MAFPFQKIRRAVDGRRMLFPLSPVRVVRHAAISICRHVFVPSCCHACLSAWWHDVMSAYVIPAWSILPFPHGLVDGCKSVEVLNMTHNTLVYCLIRAQLVLNKRMMPNKRQRKEEVRVGLDAAAFPFHRPLGVVGILLSLYITIYQHFIVVLLFNMTIMIASLDIDLSMLLITLSLTMNRRMFNSIVIKFI